MTLKKSYNHKNQIESLESMIKERNKLLVLKSNPKRLEYLTKKIDFIYWGIY